MQYEAKPNDIQNLIENSVLSATTKQAIQDVIASGTAIMAQSSATSETITSKAIVTEQGAELKDVTFSGTTTAVLDQTTGDATFTTQAPVTIEVVDGDIDLNVKNNEDNQITLSGGKATVQTGDGDDNINVNSDFTGTITTGVGDLVLTVNEVAQENATLTVDAGEGFDQLRMLGKIEHTVDGKMHGKFVLHSGEVTMEGVQLITQDTDSNGIINGEDHITILATNENDSLVGKLYKVALGREAIDGEDGWGGSTLGGINWWMNEFEKQSYNDGTVDQLVKCFLNCEEFHNKYDKMSDENYVNTLLANAGIEDAARAAAYVKELADGTSREDVAYEVVSSIGTDDNGRVQLAGTDGNEYYIVESFE